MKAKKTVLYVGNFSFPLGNAAGKRVYANGKILHELGYRVIFVGMEKEVSYFEPLRNTRKEYDGFTYYNFPYPHDNLDWVKYRKTFKKLIDFLSDEELVKDIGLVIYYGSPSLSLFNTKLIRYCKSQNIKVVTDCVDWLTIKTNNFLFDIAKWADNTYQKVYANKKADGVIAISSYLANYYKKSGCLAVIIPPLSPVKYVLSEKELVHSEMKIITYAGLPFRKGKKVQNCSTLKDRIDKTVELLHEAKKSGSNFIFNIYGFTKEEYLQAIPEQRNLVEELGKSIVFYGHKSNKEVVDSVINSDFTILIRKKNRDSTAGFPTKVSESISCGTPVITTKTSDLEVYIIEGENGFFINNENDAEALTDLVNILKINKSLKKYVNPEVFFYKRYIDKMSNFISNL